MVPLTDIHVHLLAGLDDGPRSEDDAVAMCRLSHAEGVRLSVALAHQNDSWPGVTPDRIRAAAAGLAARGTYLLIELPHQLYLDLRPLVRGLVAAGVRPILAHPERTPELLYDP